MKIALLSFHNAYNYGAALQAYGLQCAVQSLGVECEYINYQNDFRRHAYDMKHQFASSVKKKNVLGAAKYLVGMPIMAARAKGFESFYSKHLKTSKELYRSSEAAKSANGKYDKFIVGSDQVWNYSNNGGDTAYLLDFVDDDSKKISYSSSFGASSLPEDVSERYANYLQKFHRLSTRESVGIDIIENIARRKAHLVLDPVFLAGKDEWEKIRERKNQEKKYIFFYTNRQSQFQDFLNTGYVTDEVYHVLSTHLAPKEILNSRIKTRISMSPGEFLDEIANASLVVTASFHCLTLSIIYHKQFVVLLTGDHGKDERITNLLKITGLENRVLTSISNKKSIENDINYDEVDKRLAKYLKDSREYLRRAIFDEPDIPFDTSIQNEMFCQDSRCTGCGACAWACPCKAIVMESDEEGFKKPVLDAAKCVRCHKCYTVCQVYVKKESVENQQYYAVKNTDEIRRVSSSGGVFRALAEQVFSENGLVCAAGMDREFRVYHKFAKKMEELQPMCGTYYVQSDLRDVYKKVEEHLKAKRKVLFVGTACQVVGLKLFLGRQDENLLTCDILCHGAPSPMVFERFIEYLKTKGELTDFKFRDKRLGWKGYHVSAVINGEYIKDKLWLQSFNNLFSHNMINRLSCGSCQYTNYDRPGDITIGDFWGIENSHKDFLDELGISLVITNNERGNKLLKTLSLQRITEVEKDETKQNSLIKPSNISSKRFQVFQTLRTRGIEHVIRQYGETNTKGYIKNVLRKVLTK